MNVLLVHAAFPVTYWGFQYSLPFVRKRVALPPLGLVSFAALLPERWSLRLVDLNVGPLSDDDLLWADAVFVSGMLVQAPSMLDVIERARAFGRRTVVGGPACTTSPDLFAHVDHVFVGEAEGRTEPLVRAVEAPLGDGPRIFEPPPDTRPGLGHCPVPRFDLLDLRQYRAMSVQYSRGCPFACEFCDITEVYGRVPRVKSEAQVLAELEEIYRLGYRGDLFFVDDNFIGNKKAVRALLPELARWQRSHGWPFSFYTEASVNLAADPALLRAMVDAGYSSVFVGIETPSLSALRSANKKQNVGVDLAAAIETITRAGLEVMAGFIVGFDSDGPESFEAQLDFIRAAPVPLAMVGILNALPGTALWRRLEREGRLRGRSIGDQFGRPNFDVAMGDAALLSGYARLIGEVYSAGGYYARATALVERVGAPVARRAINAGDLATVLRAVVRIGILSDRRRHFWRLVGRGMRRGAAGIRHAITHAVMAEHSLRYTSEHVLPRIEQALAEARAVEKECAEVTSARAPEPVRLRVIASEQSSPAL